MGTDASAGRRRRDFVEFVIDRPSSGDSPFTATPLFEEPESLLEWLDEFPDWAGRGSGFGDLTILKEFDRQCALNPSRRVYIWSADGHLSGYDRQP